jgi:hypothetical protein
VWLLKENDELPQRAESRECAQPTGIAFLLPPSFTQAGEEQI